MAWYKVNQGDCLSSIGQQHGLPWKKIWDDAQNRSLRDERLDPNVLFPGDRLFIPELSMKEESGPTEQRHRFRRKDVPCVLKIRVLKDGEPRAGEKFILEIDGTVIKQGAIPGDGWIESVIPPEAGSGTLILGEERAEYPISIGELDPLDTVSGLQGRLKNLGYNPGPIDGIAGKQTKKAIRKFQDDHDSLRVDGIAGPKTRAALKEDYGC